MVAVVTSLAHFFKDSSSICEKDPVTQGSSFELTVTPLKRSSLPLKQHWAGCSSEVMLSLCSLHTNLES